VNKQLIVYSATDANRHFSKILKRVEKGETILITSRNRIVAEMRPGIDAGTREQMERERRAKALTELMTHLQRQPLLNRGAFSRDDAYDD
jgi:antitoxin (DNA-binding transcriptional repressor) of toxin-antitoxin stability system